MLIHNYGLFWRREDIFWGRGPYRGNLMGIKTGAKRSKPVDFRDQQGVYVLYDSSFHIIYVGQAGAGAGNMLFGRLKYHTRHDLADRWERFSWFGVREVLKSKKLSAPTKRISTAPNYVLNHVEAVLIAAAEPSHNRQRGRFG
ncbi:MAG: GIY-YIG nuclease family protein, partial [Fimbriimonadaceae bacterium]